MGLGDVSLACATGLVDALAGRGVREACVSPGSRSTPLALALARDERIRVHVHLDERGAAFFALGLANASGTPVALACTSGTAAAEYFPAIVEASQARVPLVVLTADRPPRLRGTGANQTIDQTELYGRYARAYLEPPVPAAPEDAEAWFDAGVRAYDAATGSPPGPVQVNAPFEEPLVPESRGTSGWTRRTAPEGAGRAHDADAARTALGAFLERFGGRRGVIALGAGDPPASLSLLALGTLLGWPVLAEPLSGLRLDAGQAGRALTAGQLVIGDEAWLASHSPEVVLQVGAIPTTRATQRLVARTDALIVLDRDHLSPDPEGHAERRIAVEPELFAALAWDNREALSIEAVGPRWMDAWREADLLARHAADLLLDAWDEPFEGRVARDVASFLPHGATLVIGSSTPVRDLDVFMAPRRPPRIWTATDLLRIVGNRGASGIDGLVATTLGVAAGGPGPTFALLGDLSFLYDASSFLWSTRLGLDAVFVVLANGGGQIFSMLDQASLPEHERLFTTPHPASIGSLCAAASAGHMLVQHAGDLVSALELAARDGGVQVVEVAIDAERDRVRRAELRAAVSAALAGR
jgi:2-succinyl-5-enolpyruvyl-6-hydroxy-3-cyclohexene-1-carboxylate synthase